MNWLSDGLLTELPELGKNIILRLPLSPSLQIQLFNAGIRQGLGYNVYR